MQKRTGGHVDRRPFRRGEGEAVKSKIEAATTWMENLAEDNSHGYSQANRWGPDYDCSSAIITAWQQAGVPVKDKGATYTGNMRSAFLACGFKLVTQSVNLATGEGLKRGDVLLNDLSHTAMYIGGNRIVHARSSEGNSIPGDQSGNEIRTQAYYNSSTDPWLCVLRYPETINYDDDADAEPVSEGLKPDGICGPRTWETIAEMIAEFPSLECVTDERGRIIKMPHDWHVAMLQAFLNYIDEDVYLDMDGDYGPLTAAAVAKFQRKH